MEVKPSPFFTHCHSFIMLRKLSFTAVFVCILGCSQRGPVVQFVEGTVTLDGAAVADADVCFTPKGAEGIPAVGKTDASGSYRLTSAQAGEFGKGAVAGEYDVRVVKLLDPDYVPPSTPTIGVRGGPMANPKHQLPEKYADVKTSGLTATVKKGKNKIDFHLEQ